MHASERLFLDLRESDQNSCCSTRIRSIMELFIRQNIISLIERERGRIDRHYKFYNSSSSTEG